MSDERREAARIARRIREAPDMETATDIVVASTRRTFGSGTKRCRACGRTGDVVGGTCPACFWQGSINRPASLGDDFETR